ncbi:unnamed protein product [Calypogeia fissa]
MAVPKRWSKSSALLLLSLLLPWIYVFFDLGQWVYLAAKEHVVDSSIHHNLELFNGGRALKISDCPNTASVSSSSTTTTTEERSFEALLQNSTSGKRLHNYGFMYAQYFDKLWDKELAFLEIGLREGDSLAVWKKFFRHAKVYGIDKGAIHQGFRSYAGKDPNVEIFIGDQANVTFLEDVAAVVRKEVGQLDFIIDDGGHTMTQQITSFTHLMPLVKPGGYYFIEDLETSYYYKEPCWFGCYDQCCGGGPPGRKGTTVALIKSFIDVLNEDFIEGPNTQSKWNIGYYSVNSADHMVGSFQCWRNMCAITKKKEDSYF